MPGRTTPKQTAADLTSAGTKPYRYGFNGQESDFEINNKGGTSYTAEYWQYDSRLGRRWNLDPKPTIGISDYACFRNSPVWFTDPLGDIVRVTTSEGKYLFSLDDGKTEITLTTAKQLYAQKTQWFEPLADNYMPLLAQSSKLSNMAELKHLTWQEVGDFAEVDRWMSSYRQGASGDWKQSEKGGDEYLLVTIDGKPYWGDAVGQIPFAVNKYKDEYLETGNAEGAIDETIKTGREYGEGKLIGNKTDYSNTYDNYFLLRGALWAKDRNIRLFDKTSKSSWLFQQNKPAKDLATPITKKLADKYLKSK